ncbi:MAG TPA: hypothetical protein VJJ26_00235 [Candidatus Babeliales bacterium]|nr:hypothetical protein [Candidatus Babeliales bacterium]
MKKFFCALILCNISLSYTAEKPSVGITRGKNLGDTGAEGGVFKIPTNPNKPSHAKRLSNSPTFPSHDFLKHENLEFNTKKQFTAGRRTSDAGINNVPDKK